MKKLFLILVGILALSSCTSSKVDETTFDVDTINVEEVQVDTCMTQFQSNIL